MTQGCTPASWGWEFKGAGNHRWADKEPPRTRGAGTGLEAACYTDAVQHFIDMLDAPKMHLFPKPWGLGQLKRCEQVSGGGR